MEFIRSQLLSSKRTAEEVTAGIDLEGKVAVVTGCNSGLGYETLRVLALRGAHVIGIARSMDKAARACGAVEGKATAAVLDLADQHSVAVCADEISRRIDCVDLLICNAGMMAPSRLEMIDGVEATFATNHLGHFLLVKKLLPKALASKAARVVVVSSDVAYRKRMRGIDFDGIRGAGRYSYMRAYAQSKLANALFARELARRLRDTRVRSNAVSPGFVRTNIENHAPTALKWMMKLSGPLLAKTPAQGASTTCHVAVAPELEGVSGEFFEDCRPRVFAEDHPLSDDALASKLWSFSEQLVGSNASPGGAQP